MFWWCFSDVLAVLMLPIHLLRSNYLKRFPLQTGQHVLWRCVSSRISYDWKTKILIFHENYINENEITHITLLGHYSYFLMIARIIDQYLTSQKTTSEHISSMVYFPQHNVEGLLLSWSWPCSSSLLDFLFLAPLGKTAAVVKINTYSHIRQCVPKVFWYTWWTIL